jgi:vacuolar-type H+-ATPase subunit I/STV1
MIMIKSFPFINRDDQRKHERAAFDELKPTLNTLYPMRPQEEYRKDNREVINAKKKDYRESNREKIAAKMRERYEATKEHRLTRAKDYYEENRETIKARCKEYRDANKEARTKYSAAYSRIKAQCECGSAIAKRSMTRHYLSKKHKDYMATLTPPTES